MIDDRAKNKKNLKRKTKNFDIFESQSHEKYIDQKLSFLDTNFQNSPYRNNSLFFNQNQKQITSFTNFKTCYFTTPVKKEPKKKVKKDLSHELPEPMSLEGSVDEQSQSTQLSAF